jgi:hypothetical protein
MTIKDEKIDGHILYGPNYLNTGGFFVVKETIKMETVRIILR